MKVARFLRALSLAAAMLILGVPAARASYTINIQQVGPDVVVTGSGSLDLTDLNKGINTGTSPEIQANPAFVSVGPVPTSPQTLTSVDLYSSPSGPLSFGTGTGTGATTGFGPAVAIDMMDSYLAVPHGYVSGTTLSTAGNTYSGQSFSSLGITPGTYTYTWGFAHPDSLTIQIATPEPASISLLSLTGFAFHRRSRRPSTSPLRR